MHQVLKRCSTFGCVKRIVTDTVVNLQLLNSQLYSTNGSLASETSSLINFAVQSYAQALIQAVNLRCMFNKTALL